jgi:hypothetical protein
MIQKTTRVIRRTTGKFEKVLCEERVQLIYRAAELAAGGDKLKETAYRERIDRLLGRASHLSLLLHYSRDFLKGDSQAGNRLLALLNYLVQRTEAMPAGSRPEAQQTQAEPSGGQGPSGRNPGPPGSGSQKRFHNWPCFISPLVISDIIFGVLRLSEELPRAFEPYAAVVSFLVEEVSTLEILYSQATAVHDAAGPVTYEAFDTALSFLEDSTVRMPLRGSGYLHLKFGNPGPLPLDLCRLEKWQATREAELCARQLGNEPRYEIEEIINLDRSTEEGAISRRACAGDLIEIRGRYFGGAPFVVFPGGYEPTDYPVREDGRIQCRVPEGTRSGDISIMCPISIPECARLGMSRPPARHTDRYLEISEPVTLSEFRVSGPVEMVGENRVRVEACENFTLHVAGDSADRAVLTDSSGAVIWEQEGPRISGRVNLYTQENNTYTFEISGFCGRIVRELVVETYRRVRLEVSELQVQVGHTVDLVVAISCRAPAGGVTVNLINTTGVDNVIEVPDLVEIPEGEWRTTVTLTAGEQDYEASIRGEAPDHEPGSVRLLVYDAPLLRDTDGYLQVYECTPFTLDLRGNGFDIEPSANTVRVTDGHIWRNLSVTGISFDYPHNRVHGVVLHVAGNNLPCGRWWIHVTSHGLASERPVRLEVIRESGACRAQIVRFEASPDSITIGPEGTVVTLEWEVFKARHVSIRSDVRGEVFVGEYGASCIAHDTDSLRITLNESHTFTMEAYAHEAEPVTTHTIRVRARERREEPETRGFSRVFVQNCRVDGYSVTLTVEDLTAGTSRNLGTLRNGYDSWGSCAGEVETIDLTDSHYYRITAWCPDDPIAPGVPSETTVWGDSDGPVTTWLLT